MGPTASGKTALTEALCERYPFEVISVDSALVYRDMDIGTAKPDAAMLERIPHHLINLRNPDESYSAAEFRDDAVAVMADIVSRGKMPLLVGGTMLYFKALIEGLAELPTADETVRAEIAAQAEKEGWPAVHASLALVDPKLAASLHPNHSQRIQRALEVYRVTGVPLSEWQRQQQPSDLPYRWLQIGLWPNEREQLHARIAERFEQMLAQGFIDEVSELRRRYRLHADMPSMRAVGYRQAWDYLEGHYDYATMVDKGIAATRQLAKRQFTWLRKWPELRSIRLDYAQNDHAEQAKMQIDAQLLEFGVPTPI